MLFFKDLTGRKETFSTAVSEVSNPARPVEGTGR